MFFDVGLCVLKSIPVHAPLYPEPPYKYPGARSVLIIYETEPNIYIRKILPDALEVGDMPLAFLDVMDYPKCIHLGPYNEAYLMVQAECGDVITWFDPFMWVTTEEALTAGRKIWGFPKKMADIRVVHEEERLRMWLSTRVSESLKPWKSSGSLEMSFEA